MYSLKRNNKILLYTQSVIRKKTTTLKHVVSKPLSDYKKFFVFKILLLFAGILTYEHILFCFACF